MTQWWSGGARFQCLGCGRCCRGEPGAIYFTTPEAERVAEYLGISLMELRRKFVTMRWGQPSFRERPNGDCVFYSPAEARCSIYPVRPTQCRMFPFWPEFLQSREAWDAYARKCPGMDEGPLLTPAEIEAWVRAAEDWI